MSSLWDLPDFDDHEAVHMVTDPASGLRAIIAIHSTHLGPAGGGVRFWRYADNQSALTDALRLSRGMSYKNAMAGLKMGGGKGVILAPASTVKSPDLLKSFARAIDTLGGRYVTAQDVGMSADDMLTLAETTPFVSGLPPKTTNGAGGDPGPSTAMGVYLGVKAAVARGLGKADMADVHVAIQGVGSVGGGLARHLARDGAKLTLADADQGKAAALALELGADCVSAEAIMRVSADVFSPCALGAILTEESITHLQVPIVAGGANNQLARAQDGERLKARGILYAPDYVINAGGIINVAMEYLEQASAEQVTRMVEQIPDRLTAIWDESDRTGETPSAVADSMARNLIGRG